MKKVFVLRNRYMDSVTLMGIAEKIMFCEGVIGTESGMGTKANIELLSGLGYEVPFDITKNDMIIAVDAVNNEKLEKAFQTGIDILEHRGRDKHVYHSLDDLKIGQFDIAQISLPGEYAVEEIKKALNLRMDVFIFSDNISLEDERKLKELGLAKKNLVMGPDAGVGLINGVALAAGSIIREGSIGIIGASGSGAQEVGCLIERLGLGVSCIIGTGGRDLKPEVGGITMRMSMERLEKDEKTEVICLVSKLADTDMMTDILFVADQLTKPVVAVFLGADKFLFEGHRVYGAYNLKEAAEICCELVTGEKMNIGWSEASLNKKIDLQMKRIAPERKYFRGLYCGGTFAEEAVILLKKENPETKINSNLDTKYTNKLASSHQSVGHVILDLGAEDFTIEAPHPVFDPSLRLRRLEKELEDREVAIILLDFITGPGVHKDPILPYVPVIEKHPEVVFIVTICGAAGDPQNITDARAALEQVGAIVADSNYHSAKLAAGLMAALDRRQRG